MNKKQNNKYENKAGESHPSLLTISKNDSFKKISYKDREYELDKLDEDRELLTFLKKFAKVYEVTEGGLPVHIRLEVDIDADIDALNEKSGYMMIRRNFK